MQSGDRILTYIIERELGEGGMGKVYLARHTVLDQQVAIKVLSPLLSRDHALRERFIQEANIQATLRHPGIVLVLNAGLEAEQLVLVMEYIDGNSLFEVLERRGALPLDDSLKIMGQVFSAVGYAHEKGVIHRDLKPENIMVKAMGEVKVTDFGIAKVLGSARLTRTGSVMGSAYYMSPEQIQKPEAVDARSDIYSLGCVFYELLAGRPPFGEKHSAGTDNDFRVKLAHVNEPVPKLATDVPDWLTQLIISMLEKEPDKRPLNCDMVLGKLKAGAKVVEWPPQKSSRKSCETGTTDRHKKLTNFDKPTSSSTTDIALILIIFISIVLYVQINPLQQQDSATTENSAPSFQQAIEKIAKQVENLTKKIEAGNPNNLAPCPKNQIATFLNCWGTFNWQNGDKYVGEWQGGKTNGLGTYSWSNGNRYVGEFKAGSAEGRGTYTLPNGNKYVGEIKDNKKNGLGKFTFPSGNKYIGQFKHDEYNGLGIFTFANAEKYVGEFKDGDFHGRGIKYASNGTIIESGIYAKDKLVKSKFVDPNSFSRIAK